MNHQVLRCRLRNKSFPDRGDLFGVVYFVKFRIGGGSPATDRLGQLVYALGVR